MSVFADAIKVLEERGHNRSGSLVSHGRVCMLAAIGIARTGQPDEWTTADYALIELAEPETVYSGVGSWNDHHSVEEVIAVLKKAHELSEAAG